MIKRLILSLAIAFGLMVPSHAAGTIPFSLSQQFDSLGHVLAGCQFYTIQAGTTSTPQSAYQDSALTIALPNPQTCDAAGRLPQMFLADGTIKIRLTNSAGTTQVVADNIQVIGASSGGGGGGTVDPTTILATGDFKMVYGTGVLTGFVRCNGRTIGSATSGATERANSDTQSLFQNFWDADPSLAVSGGRGVSANADWVANKTLTLPDCRGRVMAGLDDMGAPAAGRLTNTYFGTGATTLGVSGGSQSHTLTLVELPSGINSAGTNTINVTSTSANIWQGPLDSRNPASGNTFGISTFAGFISSVASSGSNSISVTSNNTGGGAHSIVPPTILVTTYIKL